MMFRRCGGCENSLTIHCAEGTDTLIITYACATQARNLCPALVRVIFGRVRTLHGDGKTQDRTAEIFNACVHI